MRRKKGFGYAKYGYLFCAPFVIAYLIFSLYPTIYTAVLGFTDSKGLGNTSWQILEEPLRNFNLILNNKTFKQSLVNTALIWTANFIPQILLALLLTAWFTSTREKLHGQGFFKVVFYMPNIITAATVAILFNAFTASPMGPLNDILQQLGIIDAPINFQVSKTMSQGVVAFIQFWMWFGYTMIILVSGVLGISPDIYEAADIDGANSAQTFFKITIPNIRTILLYTLITSLIGGINMFDIPKLYLLGGPDNSTLTVSVFIYNQAFSGSYMYNRASAASMIMFLLVAVCSAFVFFIMRDKDEVRLNKQKRELIRAARRKAKLTEGRA